MPPAMRDARCISLSLRRPPSPAAGWPDRSDACHASARPPSTAASQRRVPCSPPGLGAEAGGPGGCVPRSLTMVQRQRSTEAKREATKG
eukprot:15068778-Alexandrium_andersonii.AAC.1